MVRFKVPSKENRHITKVRQKSFVVHVVRIAVNIFGCPALVHPAMITHPNPKRVAIIGGGEGATLREVGTIFRAL